MRLFSLVLFLLISNHTFAVSEETTTNHSTYDQNERVEIEQLLEKLAINQGKGSFQQDKHFSFMSVPIKSNGQFIVNKQSALWQTQQPIFSALLLTPTAIYNRLAINEPYQLLTDSAEFSKILSTLFNGKVNNDDWLIRLKPTEVHSEQSSAANLIHVAQKCLELSPKTSQLSQLFKTVDLCLLKEDVAKNKEAESSGKALSQKRQLTLIDQQGNKTVILMSLTDELLVPSDFNALNISVDKLGKVNEY